MFVCLGREELQSLKFYIRTLDFKLTLMHGANTFYSLTFFSSFVENRKAHKWILGVTK